MKIKGETVSSPIFLKTFNLENLSFPCLFEIHINVLKSSIRLFPALRTKNAFLKELETISLKYKNQERESSPVTVHVEA